MAKPNRWFAWAGVRFRPSIAMGLVAAALACRAAKVDDTDHPSTPSTSQGPAITGQPQSQSVVAGQTATFSVNAIGTAPLAYRWTRDGADVAGATSASYTTDAAALSDSGAVFRVIVSNGSGSVASEPATLTVTASAVPPTIGTQPQSLTVDVGQTATFSVAATGTTPLAYQWTRNGTDIAGATSASYTTGATALSDSGAVLRVVVSNSAGSVTSDPATLTVNAVPPAITAQPQSRTVSAGQTATFSVTATGTAPLAYQWTRNGTNITGATSASYTTGATALSDSGAVFRVVVSNSGGSVTSNPATLTVTTGAGQTLYVYQDGVVGTNWSPQDWSGCGTNMTASFAGSTVASFDLSCAAAKDQWDAGIFANYVGSGFDATGYDTLSFDIGAADATLLSHMGVYLDGAQYPLSGLSAGNLTHVSIPLSELGAPGTIQQLGWQFLSGGTGPVIYVNNVVLTGPPVPTTPPTISGLTASQVQDYSATLTWTTDRSCTATITTQKSGGTATTVPDSARGTAHTFTLGSLEPSTTYSVTVVATDLYGNASSPATISLTTTAANDTPTVTVTLTPSSTTAISPYIYGINGLADGSGNPPHLTFDRQGGNRLTAYNWENNASNAGSDWNYSSDSYMGGGTTPDETLRSFVEADRAIGAASLVTVQMQGYVSADKNGNVDMSQPLATRLAARFKQVVFKKSSKTSDAFTVTPPTSDAYVYMDEMVWALDQKLNGQGIFSASASIPTFVCLDNEPELWNSTHKEIQGDTPEGTDDYIQKTIALATALKDQFPGMKIFGPVHYGFQGILDFQTDASLGLGNWFTDKYLKAMKAAETTAGRRLLDVYDFHWYSEAYAGGTRVVGLSSSDLTDAEVQAIVQSPRSLWDPTFTDTSDWIATTLGGPIRILARLQEKIDASYPGTKIAVTEYENGGWNHIAGTIAQADNLGIFASRGVFAASFWPPNGTYDYALAGFRAFRGFDGGSAMFGDVSIASSSSDVSKVAVHASKDSAVAGRYVFVAINRSSETQKVAINGQALSGTATTYRMTAATAASQVAAGGHVAPVLVGQAAVSGSSLFAVLPPLSVTTIAVQ